MKSHAKFILFISLVLIPIVCVGLIGIICVKISSNAFEINNKIAENTDLARYEKPITFVLPDREETVSIYEFDDPIFDENGKLVEHQINYVAFLEYMYDVLYKENDYDHIVRADNQFKLVQGEKHSEFDVIDVATQIAAGLDAGAVKFDLRNACTYREDYDYNAKALYEEIKWLNDAKIDIAPRFVDMKNGDAPKDRIPLVFVEALDKDSFYDFPDVVDHSSTVEAYRFYQYIISSIKDYVNDRYNTSLRYAKIDKSLGILDKNTDVRYETYGFSTSESALESIEDQFRELIKGKRSGIINFDVNGADGAFSSANLINGQDQDIIFVSIKDQDLRWYKLYWDKDKKDVETKLVYETPVVTGRSDKHDTPVGVYYISEKKTDKYLTGPGYRSFVNYWMRLTNQGVGLHDASWRGSFGEDIYKTNGSHGCINMSKTSAAELYSKVGVGQCVVITDSGFQKSL